MTAWSKGAPVAITRALIVVCHCNQVSSTRVIGKDWSDGKKKVLLRVKKELKPQNKAVKEGTSSPKGLVATSVLFEAKSYGQFSESLNLAAKEKGLRLERQNFLGLCAVEYKAPNKVYCLYS